MSVNMNPKILVINDEPEALELTVYICRQAGFGVLTANNGTTGLKIAQDELPDLIISRIRMPGLNGIEFCRQIRADCQLKNIPIVLAESVHEATENVVKALEAGADDYIELPFEPVLLVAKVSRLIERKKMEDQFLESESRYNAIISNTTDIISFIASDSTVLYESPSIEGVLGYQPDELIGRNAFEFVHPDDLQPVISVFKQSILSTVPVEPIEYQFLHKDGTWRYLESTGRAFYDPKTKQVVGLVTSRDITNRKKADIALKVSESELRALFASMTDVIFVIDRKGRYKKIAPTKSELFVAKPSDLLGKKLHEIFPPEQADLFLEQVELALTKGELHNFEYSLNINGKDVWFYMNGFPISDDEVLWVARDITERKRIEDERTRLISALNLERNRLAEIFQLAASFIVTFRGSEHVYEMANPAYLRLINGRDIIGKTVRDAFPEFEGQGAFEMLDKVYKTGQTFVEEERLFKFALSPGAPLESRYLNLFYMPLFDTDGSVSGVLCHGVDMTEQVLSRNALLKSKERYQELIENANDIIYTTDLEGKFTSLNKAGEQVLGYERQEVVNLSFADVVAPEYLEQVRDYIMAKLHGVDKTKYEVKVKAKDNREVFIEINSRTIYEGGKPVGFQGIARDITERRIAEQERLRLTAQIEKQRERLNNIIATIPGVVWESSNSPDSPIQRVDFINDYAETMLGYGIEEWLSTPNFWISIVHPDDRERVERTCAEHFTEGRKYTEEFRLIAKDGRVVWLQSQAVPVFDEAGNLIRLRGVNLDITERRQMEEALRESREHLALAQQVGLMGSFEYDLETGESIVSEDLETLYGVARDTFKNNFSEWSKYVYPEDLQIANQQLERSLLTGDFETEFRIVKPSGEMRWVHAKAKTFKEGNKPKRSVGVNMDITDRKKAEESLNRMALELRSTVNALQEIMDNSLDVICTIDSEGKFIQVSAATKEVLGYEPEELIGMSYIKMVHPKDRRKTARASERVRSGTATRNFQNRYIRKNGSIAELMWSAKWSETDKITFCVARDITEIERVEKELEESREQLMQAQKLESVGRLAGGIAHDFNNMLTVINGYSELVLRDLDQNDSIRSDIEEIKKAGERSALLTHQLLAFSRRQILQPKILDLDEVISDTIKMLRRLIGEDMQLNIISKAKSTIIKADPGQLTQMIMNLAINARDAMPQGGIFTIETANVGQSELPADISPFEKNGNFVMLSIRDTGVGMNEEVKEHIFEPFFTTKGVGKGTGLGLATVYGIIKQSDGHIMVNSEMGVGTTFNIYFPLIEITEKFRKPNGEQTELPWGTETILLVEDEEIVRKLNRQMLEKCGYQVIEASNGAEALSVINQQYHKIDLLLTDVVMPEMSGRELAEHLAQTHPEIITIYMSGYTNDSVIRHGIREIGTNFLQKPFTLHDLAFKLREALETRRN